MPNDNKLKGSGAARHNNIKHRDKAHPWHLPYLSTCIIKDCRTKPYYDGSTYFTCCLSCLRERELGPFFRNPNPRLFKEGAQTPALPKIATTDDTDGVVIPVDSNDLWS